mgnify:CR=1 FL=1
MKKLCKDFLKCGTLGWCLEILVSGAEALRRQDKTLTCHTSLWMFPIYGCACLIGPLYRILKHLPKTLRGLIYMTGIFSVEYATGPLELPEKPLEHQPCDSPRLRAGVVFDRTTV